MAKAVRAIRVAVLVGAVWPVRMAWGQVEEGIDRSVFAQYATNVMTAPPTGGQRSFSNLYIKAGVNPVFAGGSTIRGVVYIETPNQVTFLGHTNIQGVVVEAADGNGSTTTNTISFLQGDFVAEDPGTLPPSFGGLGQLAGSVLLAPDFGVSMNGSFSPIDSSMTAGAFVFVGNAGGTVNGTVAALNGNVSLGGNSRIGVASLTVSGSTSLVGNRALHLVPQVGDAAQSASVLTLPSIGFASTVDVDSAMIVNDVTSPDPDYLVRQYIIKGRGGQGFGNATWVGLGGFSSTAAADTSDHYSTAIGYAENADLPLGSYTSFGGQTVDANSILVRYTLGADANLDGKVDVQDLAIVGANFNRGGGEWCLGDFDYSGSCDVNDVFVLGALFDPAMAPSADQLSQEYGSDFASAFEAGQAARVPEPTSLGLFLPILLLCRRR